MKILRTGKYYRLFTLKCDGVTDYYIGRLNKKTRLEIDFCYVSENKGKAVKKFEQLERSNGVKEK